MRELDELLQRYLDRRYADAPANEQRAFEQLLQSQDPELQAYLLSDVEPRDPEMQRVVHAIRAPRV